MTSQHESMPLPGALPAEAPVQPAGAEDKRGVPWGRPAGAAVQAGAAGTDPAAPASPLSREAQDAAGEDAFEADYLQWREAQLRALDEDYRAWLQDGDREAGDDFAGRFTRWRAGRAAADGQPGPGRPDPAR